MLPTELADAMHAHEKACAPQEAAGLFAMSGDEVVEFYPLVNQDRSAVSYSIDGADILRCAALAEQSGHRLGGVVHSHPHSRPEPSERDIAEAAATDWIYVITGRGSLAAFTLARRRTRRVLVMTP